MINPLLTSPVLSHACGEARRLYLETLDRQRLSGGLPLGVLTIKREQSRQNLDNFWQAAELAATRRDLQGVAAQLVVIIREWALYRAYTDLVDAEALAVDLDPDDPETARVFDVQVQHRHVEWATSLFNLMPGQDGRDPSLLPEPVPQHLQPASEVSPLALIQAVREVWSDAHLTNERYADLAFRGIEAAQQGAGMLFDAAQATQRDAVDALGVVHQHLSERLPSAVAEARRQERGSRLTCFVMMLVCVALLFGLGFWLIHLF